MILAACLGLGACAAAAAQSAPQTQAGAPSQASSGQHRVAAAIGEEIRKQASQEQELARASLSPDAIEAVTETHKALDAIARQDKAQAMAALERAIGKLDILLARNPKSALIPVDFAVSIVDSAPADPKAIGLAEDAARDAMRDKRLADARALLDLLRSEIQVRTYQLPLATYPLVLRDVARLVDQNQRDEAARALNAALGTLVVVDKSVSLPLVEVRANLKIAGDAAQKKDAKAAAAAQASLNEARAALIRAEALGQVDTDARKNFQQQMAALERQVSSHGESASAFARLRDDLMEFIRKHAPTRSAAQATRVSQR